MASEQAEEWAKAMREKMQSFIKHETLDLILKNDIIFRHCFLKKNGSIRSSKVLIIRFSDSKQNWLSKIIYNKRK